MFYDAPADFLSALPERLQRIREFQILNDAVGPRLDEINAVIGQLVSHASISTADETGVLRWEKILGVSTPLNSTLTARREALRARLMTKPPINLVTLKNIIEAYMGVGVEISIAEFIVRVVYRGTSRVADLTPLFVTVYETIPADLIVSIAYKYLVWDELDAQELTFDQLDALSLNWNEFERGEWIG